MNNQARDYREPRDGGYFCLYEQKQCETPALCARRQYCRNMLADQLEKETVTVWEGQDEWHYNA